MNWVDAIPNLLIGLREGLEAGLVVSILLAALKQANSTATSSRRLSSASIWLGVVGAISLAGSFAAVLTFSTSVLSSRAQEAVGGSLSVLSVLLVTGMIFWMRRTAMSLSRQLKGEVHRALRVGAGALTLTAFLAVGREGLETTLFMWTAVRASGSTVSPLVGATIGLALAVVLCWLLYRRAVRLNLGVFFNRTAIALIVIAAGVLSYGLGDLQDAGLLSGQRWIAFDLTGHVSPNAWWVTVISGVTDLTPKMTVLQVVVWAGYLTVVLTAFLLSKPTPVLPGELPDPDRPVGRWEQLAGRRPLPVGSALVLAPVLIAAAAIVALPSAASAQNTTLMVSKTGCAQSWKAAHPGNQNLNIDNQSGLAGEINLDDAAGGVVAEIETIGPGTTATMSANLSAGDYTIRCLLSGRPVTSSPVVSVTGAHRSAQVAFVPVTLAELAGPNRHYERYAAKQLGRLASVVSTLRGELVAGRTAAAKREWLAAQSDWERVGASYDSFGAEGLAADGLPDGLVGGVHSKDFTGLHRLEYGLWHGASAASLVPVATMLEHTVVVVRRNLDTEDLAGDPTNLPIRAHEILEDALRDHLSGIDDLGASAAYPETYADTEVTSVVLHELSAPLNARVPGLDTRSLREVVDLQKALLATRAHGRWQRTTSVGRSAKEQVDATIGTLLQTLSQVPDVLEVPPSP